ncbi:hypothetical protein B0H14DRAFT_3574543 [Mycena olivaceomarginata]|nr:hypothetical protein B0H14DRAFT_3574543 [Mycena olivaceomarginata]
MPPPTASGRSGSGRFALGIDVPRPSGSTCPLSHRAWQLLTRVHNPPRLHRCRALLTCAATPIQPPLGPAPQTHLHPSRHRPPIRHPTRARLSVVRCLAGPVPPPLVAPRTRLGIGTPIQLAAIHPCTSALVLPHDCGAAAPLRASRRPFPFALATSPRPHPHSRPLHVPCALCAAPPDPSFIHLTAALFLHAPSRPASTLLPHPPPVRCHARPAPSRPASTCARSARRRTHPGPAPSPHRRLPLPLLHRQRAVYQHPPPRRHTHTLLRRHRRCLQPRARNHLGTMLPYFSRRCSLNTRYARLIDVPAPYPSPAPSSPHAVPHRTQRLHLQRQRTPPFPLCLGASPVFFAAFPSLPCSDPSAFACAATAQAPTPPYFISHETSIPYTTRSTHYLPIFPHSTQPRSCSRVLSCTATLRNNTALH